MRLKYVFVLLSILFLYSCDSAQKVEDYTDIDSSYLTSSVKSAIDVVNAKSGDNLLFENVHYIVDDGRLFIQNNDDSDYRAFVFSLSKDIPVFLYEERTYLPFKNQFLDYEALEPFMFNFTEIPQSYSSIEIYPEYPTDEMTFSDIFKWSYPSTKESDIFAFRYRGSANLQYSYILVKREILNIQPDSRNYGEIVMDAIVNDGNSCFDFADSDVVDYEFADGILNVKILCGDKYMYDPLLYVNLLRFPDVKDVVFSS